MSLEMTKTRLTVSALEICLPYNQLSLYLVSKNQDGRILWQLALLFYLFESLLFFLLFLALSCKHFVGKVFDYTNKYNLLKIQLIPKFPKVSESSKFRDYSIVPCVYVDCCMWERVNYLPAILCFICFKNIRQIGYNNVTADHVQVLQYSS